MVSVTPAGQEKAEWADHGDWVRLTRAGFH